MDFDYAAHGLSPPEHRPEIPGGPRDISKVLDRTLEKEPESLGLVGRHGRFSYAELDAAANRAAHALAELGVGAGDRVAACLPNDVDIVLAFLGCMRLGALWVGVNRPLAAPEKAYLLRDSGAVVFLAGPETLAELERKVLWLSSWMIHHANHVREKADGLKVGGHQASSASLATIMTVLYLDVLHFVFLKLANDGSFPASGNYACMLCPLHLLRHHHGGL